MTSFLSGNLSAGSNVPHLSPMQTDKSIVKPLSDSGVTVGNVPFSTPEQIQCVIDKGVPANLAKIMALRANNDCNEALEIYEGGWRNHVVNAADSWWPNQAGGKKRLTRKRKLKMKKSKLKRKKSKKKRRKSRKRKTKRN
jgi:hypothetical protein